MQNRKLMQLHKQAERVISSMLADCSLGATTENCMLLNIENFNNPNLLHVVIGARVNNEEELKLIKAGLDQHVKKLRWTLTNSLHRKRAPNITFHVLRME